MARNVLKGLPAARDLCEAFEITRSLPHGHVAAVLGSARALGVEELIDPDPSRRRNLVTAMLVAQVIAPGSKLATARGLREPTATSSLGAVLGVCGCDEDDLYAAMDWTLARQDTIEKSLAARHLVNGTLVLYDVSSAAFEGRTCPLGAGGHVNKFLGDGALAVFGPPNDLAQHTDAAVSAAVLIHRLVAERFGDTRVDLQIKPRMRPVR